MEQGPVISGLQVKLYVKGPVITSMDGGVSLRARSMNTPGLCIPSCDSRQTPHLNMLSLSHIPASQCPQAFPNANRKSALLTPSCHLSETHLNTFTPDPSGSPPSLGRLLSTGSSDALLKSKAQNRAFTFPSQSPFPSNPKTRLSSLLGLNLIVILLALIITLLAWVSESIVKSPSYFSLGPNPASAIYEL